MSVEDRDMLVNDSRGLLKPGQIFVFGCINAEHKIKTGTYQLVVIPYRYFFQGLRIGGVSIDDYFIKDAESFSLRLVVAIRPWGSEKYMNGKYAHSDASKRLFSVLVNLIDDICFAAESVIILFKGDSRDVELSHQVFSRLCAHYRFYKIFNLDCLMNNKINFDFLLAYILEHLDEVRIVTLDSSIPVPFIGEEMGEFYIGAPIGYLEAAAYSQDFQNYFARNIKVLERDINAIKPDLYVNQENFFLVPKK